MPKFFKPNELKCKCGQCGSTGEEMDVSFMCMLDAIREKYKKPMILTSAYRCATYNSRVSSSGSSGAHTTGKAVDVLTRGEDAILLIKIALTEGIIGLGVDQKNSGRFIHLDMCNKLPRPMIWSY